MTRNENQATCHGGPLDGLTLTKRGGRWCCYRDDDGRRVPTRRGDQEWCQRGRRPARGYAHQRCPRRGHVYVHASLWPRQEAPEVQAVG